MSHSFCGSGTWAAWALWFRVFSPRVIKVLVGAMITSSLALDRIVFKLHCWPVGRPEMIHLQGHSPGSGQARYPHWLLEGGIISFPHGLLHHKTACFTQTFSGFKTGQRECKMASEIESSVFLKTNIESFITSILFLKIESLGPVHTQGEAII